MIFSWFKAQRPITKLFIVIALLGLAYALYTGLGKAYYKYQYFKAIEKKLTTAQDSIQALNTRIDKLTQKQQTKTKAAKKKANSIDQKLKQDEKTIDNSDIADDELADFISKHEKG